MENVFKQYLHQHSVFMWESLGDIKEGRGELGENMPVLVYRLMLDTLLETLTKNIGENKAEFFFHDAGRLAGYEFAQNCLTPATDFETFADELGEKLMELRIGVLAVEKYDRKTGEVVITLKNDVSCSGRVDTQRNLCRFEEGFLGGTLYAHTGEDHLFEEVACWSSGDRLCRFKGRVMR